MDLLNQIGKRLTDVGQGVARQTKTIAEITRLTAVLYDMEKKLTALYAEFGKEVYSSGSYTQSELLLEQANSIGGLETEIGETKELIEKLKQMVKEKELTKCSCCGANIAGNARFCNECGVSVQKGNGKSCPDCGKQAEEGATFCIHCGTKLCSEEVIQVDENVNAD